MPRQIKMTEEDKRWRAESDARTLADAQRIAEDKTRLSAAKKEAARMAADAAKSVSTFSSVAQIVSNQKSEPKPKEPKRKALKK